MENTTITEPIVVKSSYHNPHESKRPETTHSSIESRTNPMRSNSSIFSIKSVDNHSNHKNNDDHNAYSMTFKLETEEDMKNICTSHLFTSWQHELFLIHQKQPNNDLLIKNFPIFTRLMHVLSNPKLFFFSLAIVLWNSIAVVTSVIRCKLTDTQGGYGFAGFFFPLVFLLFHYQFCNTWRGSVAIHDVFRPSINRYYQNNVMHTLNQILYYIQSNEHLIHHSPFGEITLCVEKKGYKLFYALFGCVIPLATFFTDIWLLVTQSLNPNLRNECAEYFYFTGGYSSLFYGFIVCSNITIFLLNLIYITSNITSVMINVWINRYIPLQRMKLSDLKYYSSEKKGIVLVADSIRRDAYERYLLIHFFVHQVSQLFNTPVVCLLSFSAALFVWYLYLAFVVTEAYIVSVVCWILLNATVFFFTMGCVTACNTSIDRIYRQITYSLPLRNQEVILNEEDLLLTQSTSSAQEQPTQRYIGRDTINFKGDYEVIGGREEWLAYLTTNPIYWKVYGFAFTTGWIQSLALAAISAAVVAIIPTISGYLI